MTRSAVIVACLAAALTRTATAQRGDAPFEGPRGVFSFAMSDGEPISQFLEWSRALDLSESQKARLMDLRRRLRVQNAPLVARLDSLRDLAGVDMSERGRITQKDREALARFQAWSQPVADSIRANNDVARAEARALLLEGQRSRLDSMTARVREERRDRPRGTRPPPLESLVRARGPRPAS